MWGGHERRLGFWSGGILGGDAPRRPYMAMLGIGMDGFAGGVAPLRRGVAPLRPYDQSISRPWLQIFFVKDDQREVYLPVPEVELLQGLEGVFRGRLIIRGSRGHELSLCLLAAD